LGVPARKCRNPDGLQPQRKDKALAQNSNTPQKGTDSFLKKLINGPWFWPGAIAVVIDRKSVV